MCVIKVSRISSLIPACPQLCCSCSPPNSCSRVWEYHQPRVEAGAVRGCLFAVKNKSELDLETEFCSLPGAAV